MKITFPTLAGPILITLLIAGCSFKRLDGDEHCRVQCTKCENLIFECNKNIKSDDMDTGVTVENVIN